jgi:two-component system C4-dicarboxylate transport sensor histidine kinase DctB
VGERIGYVAVKRDITERLEVESRLLQGQKLEAVGVLAAGIAHEINNPLFGISGFAELIELEPGCPAGVSELAGKIVGETDRIARIVNSLLEFARPGADGESTVDIRVLVDHTLTLLRPRLANIGASVHSRVEPGCEAFIGARGKVQQVLLNLLSNACDAVAGRPAGQPAPRIDVVAEPAPGDAGTLRLVVRDNGPGIDHAQSERLFVPFHTTKGPGKGTGLGLSVSRRLAIEMGGSLEHRPGPGGGAEFHLTLPRAGAVHGAKGGQAP